jgi:uncharacterized protein (TIGR03083 family)
MGAMSVAAGVARGIDFVAEFAAAAERFAVAVGEADLHAPVAACLGWSTYDLVRHLGNVHAWAATIVETGQEAVEQDDAPPSRRRRAVAEWYAAKAEDLYQVLWSADPHAPCWNFAFGVGEAGFWPRRQLHETLMHSVDLGLTDLPADLAADGVDETLTVFLKRMHDRGHPAALTAPLALVASDVGRAWTLTPRQVRSESHGPDTEYGGPPLVVQRLYPQADRVEAPAAVLDRLLWKRVPVDHPGVRVTGDRERVATLLAGRLSA